MKLTDEDYKEISYEPGNATHYQVVLVNLPGQNANLVVWANRYGTGGRTLITYGEGAPHHTYIMEKLDCGLHDARALEELLEYLIDGKDRTGPPEA